MSRDLPWEEPYTALLGELVTHWRGSRSDSDDGLSDRTRSATALMIYPVYSGEMRGFPFTIQISAFPIFRPERFELSGNAEYLRVHISRSLACNLEIHNRNLLSSRMLAGRTDDAITLGKASPDDQYMLEVRSEADRVLLDNSQCRQIIGRLEPFAVIALTPTGVYWAQEIIGAHQLEFQSVENYVQHLIDLVDAFTS